jgi:DNA-binding transcriptional MerR regulator
VIAVPDPDLVPTADAARMLGISARTLARYAQQGVVRPAVVLPSGHLRWDVTDLRRQLREIRQSGKE